jgi:hypothetical protein
MPVCEAVRLTRKAISPRLAIRMERRGSVDMGGAVLVLVCLIVRLGWSTAVVLRRARSLDGVDMLEESSGGLWQGYLHGLAWGRRVSVLYESCTIADPLSRCCP